MTDPVRVAYDANAELYASLFSGELAKDDQTLHMLAEFMAQASGRPGPVAGLGCGPGDVVAHLTAGGVDAFGLDISAGQVEQARLAHPGLRFEVGDLTALDVDDRSLGGIVSRYSIIHLPPEQLAAVFTEWYRALEPGSPLGLAFFGARSADRHGEPFDHKVVTAYAFDPATIGDLVRAAGFVDVRAEATPLPEGGRPFDHATLLARRAPTG